MDVPFPLQTAADLLRSRENRKQKPPLPTRIAPFDRLQGGGFERGSFVELNGPRSSGRFAIALSALASATRTGEAAALIDVGDHLDPRGAQEAGVDLRRLLWVRPRALQEALMAAEMVLATGFALVVLDLGSRPLFLHRVPPSAWVRLARTAEAHNAILLLLSPTPARSPGAFAIVTAHHARPVWSDSGATPLLSGIGAQLRLVRKKGARGEGVGDLVLGMREWGETA